MPVASFCASETAETGRIANGREQGDHVSRRQSGKGLNWVSAKPPLRRTESRFAEPRKVSKGFNFVRAKPSLRRAESRFGKPRKVSKGFNFVSGKLLFGWADSRFAKPRTSRKGNGLVLFAACKKYRKNTLGRAKSCRWQVFVRRRPPKQGELRTDVSKATMFQGDRGLRPSGLRGRFKALPEIYLENFPAARAETGFVCITPA